MSRSHWLIAVRVFMSCVYVLEMYCQVGGCIGIRSFILLLRSLFLVHQLGDILVRDLRDAGIASPKSHIATSL